VNRKALPTLYVSGQSEAKLNYQRPYKFSSINDSAYEVNLDDTLKLRTFRFYFEYPGEKIEISDIALKTSSQTHHLNLHQDFYTEKLKIEKSKDQLKIEVQEINGFLDSPKRFLYPSDFNNLYQLIFPIFAIIILLTFVVFHIKSINLKALTLSEITLSFLILSIFLPAPIYNIALILMAIVNIRKINIKKIFEQKINLIIIAFFLLYLLNNVFVSEEGYKSMGTIERFLPFLIIPVFIPSISNRKLLGLFPVSAIALGFGMLITSIFDAYIHGNATFLSFDNFSKFLHPVYYSYLLFFSIIYVHYEYHSKIKLIIQIILFGFLILSGSKLILLFTILMMVLTMLKSKKTLLLAGTIIIISLLFSPLINRYKTIFKTDDLSLLNEKHIENHNDARINGLTLRLILWREALATMQDVEYIIGKGVAKDDTIEMKERLANLGLEKHQNYNPHNQYVDTFMRTGIFGLILLLVIPIYCLIWAIKSKDVILMQFSVLMIVVMLTESIFGRVNGIYFFTLTLIILMNSRAIHENSNIRNERNTQ
jgi:hypothetical protein